MDFDGRNPRRLTNHKSLILNPDARAAARSSSRATSSVYPQIWIMNADGSGAARAVDGDRAERVARALARRIADRLRRLREGQPRHLRR